MKIDLSRDHIKNPSKPDTKQWSFSQIPCSFRSSIRPKVKNDDANGVYFRDGVSDMIVSGMQWLSSGSMLSLFVSNCTSTRIGNVDS